MRKFSLVVGIATVFVISFVDSFGQLDALFALPFDSRGQTEYFIGASVSAQPITIDSTLITVERIDSVDAREPWQRWNLVENFTFGKDRGALSMIADLDALHPFFRDKVRDLIVRCKAQGIELAIVETYRTHAKQNEYRSMGRKYTNSAGGKSKHQYGLAVDVVPVVSGVAVWDNLLLWRKVGVIGEKMGLRWGGRWKKPYDPGHFEWTGGLTSSHLAAGMLPSISTEKYPCIQEDIAALREFWGRWEDIQEEALSQKIKTARSTSTNSPQPASSRF